MLNRVLFDNCASTRPIGLCCRRVEVRSTLKVGYGELCATVYGSRSNS